MKFSPVGSLGAGWLESVGGGDPYVIYVVIQLIC